MKKLAFGLLNLYRKFKLFSLRLRGMTAEDEHSRRVISGTAWEEFCENLKPAGAALLYGNSPKDEFNQAEGYRYLTRLVRASLEAFVEYSDASYPVLRRMVHETVKMGADNPDNYYQNAKVSGQFDYRIHGSRGTVHYLGFGTQRGDYGKTGNMEPSGYLEGSELELNSDNTFEIIVSKDRHEGNWLPMAEDSSILMVRQTYLDRSAEKLAELKIERIGGSDLPSQITPKQIDEGLVSAGAFVAGASMFFSRWSNGFKEHKNNLPRFDQKVSNAAGGDDNIAYYHSYWELAEDEALVIETTPPECEHWNFQLNNYWMESLDYRYFTIHINKHTAVYNDDGSVTIIIAHKDPDQPNWINTVGHKLGTMCFRWVKASNHPEPVTRVVKFKDSIEL